MRRKNRFSKIAYLVLIGLCLTLPAFIYAYASGEGNTTDKILFGISLVGFVLILIGVFLGIRKEIHTAE